MGKKLAWCGECLGMWGGSLDLRWAGSRQVSAQSGSCAVCGSNTRSRYFSPLVPAEDLERNPRRNYVYSDKRLGTQ